MRLRNLIATIALTAGIAAAMPAAAGASVTQELQASGVVERMAARHWRSYDFIAGCDQYGRGRFWCDVSGDAGNCYRQGHADVKRTVRARSIHWDVWLHGFRRECF